MLAALYRNSWFDRIVNAVTLTTISFPEFFVAYILMLFFAVKFPIFYSLSNGQRRHAVPRAHLQRSALPALTLTLVIVAHMMRMTRAAIINLLASPYIEMARLKGVSRGRRSSCAMRFPMPGRRSPTSSPSTSPISSSAWWWSKWCSSIRASARLMVDAVSRARHAGGAGLRADLRRDLHPAQSPRRHHLDRHQSEAAAPKMTHGHDSTSRAPRMYRARRTAAQNIVARR